MMQSDFLILRYDQNLPNACYLDDFENVEELWELDEGISRAEGFPDNAVFRMHPDRPHDTLLPDLVRNSFSQLVISPRFQAFLEQWPVRDVEYLPVTILDHKNRPASKDFVISHPVHPIECLDIEKSHVRWNVIDEEVIDRVKQLVLFNDMIDKSRAMFRIKHFYRVILVRRNLANAISKAGFTGIRWIELTDYPE